MEDKLFFSHGRDGKSMKKDIRSIFWGCDLCAKRNAGRGITVLQTNDGRYVTECKDILRLCKKHFEEVNKSSFGETEKKGTGIGTAEFRWPVCPQLSDFDKASCDGRIMNEECIEALRSMLNNKSPSVSGFSKEFFYVFLGRFRYLSR